MLWEIRCSELQSLNRWASGATLRESLLPIACAHALTFIGSPPPNSIKALLPLQARYGVHATIFQYVRNEDVDGCRPAPDIRHRGRNSRRLGSDGSDVRLFGYVAAGDQYRHDHCDLPDGLPDSEQPEPRCCGDAGQAR